MSKRNIYSRPRTRLYNANYNIGESYYKSALDGLDRKYSTGLRTSSTPPRFPSVSREFSEKPASLFDETDDLNLSRKRAEKVITEANILDTRGGHLASARNGLDTDIDEEAASVLSRIRSRIQKVSAPVDDVDLDSTFNNIKSSRLIKRSEKILDSVGINDSSRKFLNDEVSIKRQIRENGSAVLEPLTKWTPLVRNDERHSINSSESAAISRARETKNRLVDLEDEMNDIAERRAAREKRVARYKAIVAENCEERDEIADVSSLSLSRKEKKSVHF